MLYDVMMEIMGPEINKVIEERTGRLVEERLIKARKQAMEQGLEQGLERGLEQGLEQGLERGLERGRLIQLFELVDDGGVTAEYAAKKAGMSVEEFLSRKEDDAYYL